MSVSLLSLPNELLLAIIAQADSAADALQLLRVSRRLRAVWLKNQDTIISTLLRRVIIAYDAAYRLAQDTIDSKKLALGRPPVIVHYLLENEAIAQLVVSDFRPWYVAFHPHSPHCHLLQMVFITPSKWAHSALCRVLNGRPNHLSSADVTTPFEAYYFIRRLVLLLRSKQPLPVELTTELDEMGLSTLRVVYDLSDFMCNDHMTYELQRRQGMLKDETISEIVVGVDGIDNIKGEWHLADELIDRRLFRTRQE